MFSRRWLYVALVLLIGASMSGCLGSDDADPHDHSTHDHGDGDGNETDDGNGTGSGGTGGNTGGTGGTGGNETAALPMALFNITPEAAITVDMNITFNASASEDPDGGELIYEWDFGDGETADGPVVYHAYAATGNYTATLTVYNGAGNSNETNLTIEVGQAGAFWTDQATGTVTAPYPAFAFVSIYSSKLADYETLGGAEGTTYEKHVFTDVPTGSKMTFDLTAPVAGGVRQVEPTFLVFNADGDRIAGVSAGFVSRSVELTDPGHLDEGTYTVLVYSTAVPNVAYTLDVTVE